MTAADRSGSHSEASPWKDRLLDVVVERWASPVILALVALVASGVVAFSLIESLDRGSPIAWGLVGLTPLAVSAVWVLTNWVGKAPKGSIGLVIAIATESDEHNRQLRSDFITSLREHLLSDTPLTRFSLTEYGRRLAARVIDRDRAVRYMRKSRARMIVFGRARTRPSSNGDVHVLTISGVIEHPPIDPADKRLLATEFGQFLPRQWLISKENDFVGFEVTSESFDLAARYVVGVAAMVSGDFSYAESMLRGVQERLPRRAMRLRPTRELARRLPGRVENLYLLWISALREKYLRTRDDRVLEDADAVADKLLALNPEYEIALEFKALAHFVLDRDVAGSRRLLARCRKSPYGVWRYSSAFLFAYEGQLKKAREQYERAFRSRMPDGTIPTQVEEFIQIILDEEPERIGLHFALGLIAFEGKADYLAAREDFRRFIARSAGGFPEEEQLAREYMDRASVRLQVEDPTAPTAVGVSVPPALLGRPDVWQPQLVDASE
jgi:tetratricopeptide (TPR) repeat protein